MPDEPLVVQVLREFREAVLAGEAAQLAAMTRRWAGVERALEAQIEALSLRIAELRAAGETISESRLFQLDRYQSLLAQAQVEIGRYNAWAEGRIERGQRVMAEAGLEKSVEAINAVYLGAGVVPDSFKTLPISAVEHLIGLAGDGSPLRALLDEAYPKTATAITQALIDAVALGANPRVTARLINESMSVGLNQSLTLARTEQLRAFRESSRLQYQQSGVVGGYKRLAAHDGRVCPACLFADGREYSLNEPLDEHPQGRCTLVPEVIGLPVVEWQNGITWFEAQDAAMQREILGAGRYDAWRDGAFELADVVGRRQDGVWGASLYARPLSSLAR